MTSQNRQTDLLLILPTPEVFDLARALARAMVARSIADALHKARGGRAAADG